jgi:phosphatidate cytidylyltransferase
LKSLLTSHAQRWLTGVIAGPLLLLLILKGSALLFCCFVVLVVILASLEYEKLVTPVWMTGRRWEFILLAPVIPCLVYFYDLDYIFLSLSLIIVTLLLCDLLRQASRHGEPEMGSIARIILGFIYIAVFMSYFILIRALDHGPYWLVFIIVLAFSGDVAAFYTGKLWGRNKLLPSVSPNKTSEGFIGLIAGSVVGCGIYGYFLLPHVSMFYIFGMAFLGSIIGQLGDLFESAIKREAGSKDSGRLLPGQGGIMDRIDCLLFMAPFIYYVINYWI